MSSTISKKIARIGYGLLIVLIIVLGAIISVGNSSLVALELMTYRTGELPLAMWLVIAFLLGMATSAIVLSGSYFKSKIQNRSLHVTLRKLQTDATDTSSKG